MWTVVRRAVVPIVLLLGSAGSVIYGAKYHSASVLEEQEREIRLAPPPEAFPPGMLPGMPPGDGFVPDVPSPLPFPSTAIEKVEIFTDTTELTLIREVTFGGIARLASGQLKRTYTGKAPSLCPT